MRTPDSTYSELVTRGENEVANPMLQSTLPQASPGAHFTGAHVYTINFTRFYVLICRFFIFDVNESSEFSTF